jgi:hypothetical protein
MSFVEGLQSGRDALVRDSESLRQQREEALRLALNLQAQKRQEKLAAANRDEDIQREMETRRGDIDRAMGIRGEDRAREQEWRGEDIARNLGIRDEDRAREQEWRGEDIDRALNIRAEDRTERIDERTMDRDERAFQQAQENEFRVGSAIREAKRFGMEEKRDARADAARIAVARKLAADHAGPRPVARFAPAPQPEELEAMQAWEQRRDRAAAEIYAALGLNASPERAQEVAYPQETRAARLDEKRAAMKDAATIEAEAAARARGGLQARQTGGLGASVSEAEAAARARGTLRGETEFESGAPATPRTAAPATPREAMIEKLRRLAAGDTPAAAEARILLANEGIR